MSEDRRFGGIARLYGNEALARFKQSHICVIGVGGVGSWVVEALARSAVGEITLIDADHVAESNINRQLVAMDDTLGMAKIDVLAERIALINADCKVNKVDDFVDNDNLDELIPAEADWIIDCIDSFRTKAALIAFCRERKQRILTIGGAGGIVDATRVQVTDLRKSEYDPLLSTTRRLLRQNYNFPRNLRRNFRVPCVWSDEIAVAPEACDSDQDSSLNCAGFGASMPITTTFAMLASGHILKSLSVPE